MYKMSYREIPDELLEDYTLGGKIPLSRQLV